MTWHNLSPVTWGALLHLHPSLSNRYAALNLHQLTTAPADTTARGWHPSIRRGGRVWYASGRTACQGARRARGPRWARLSSQLNLSRCPKHNGNLDPTQVERRSTMSLSAKDKATVKALWAKISKSSDAIGTEALGRWVPPPVRGSLSQLYFFLLHLSLSA